MAIKSFEIKGSSRKNILVAIGPSISGDNYLLDTKTFYNFFSRSNKILRKVNKIDDIDNDKLVPLDIKRHAYLQLIMEDIDPSNIDISNKCTFSFPDELNSWRRSKSDERQWSVICS